MTHPVTVRPATLDDATHIVSFNRAMAWETEQFVLDAADSDAGVRAALKDPERCAYYIALVGTAVVGQTMITTEWSDWRNSYFWWIQSVYVLPSHRRQGVFRSLHGFVRDLAKDRGDVCGIRLYVFNKNERALSAYEQLGMTTTDYLLCEEIW